MAKKKKTKGRTRKSKYDTKLKIHGSFAEAVKVLVSAKPKKEEKN